MSVRIASTAIVDPSAELDDDVEIGHYCVIGPKVSIGRGTRLENNVTITGRTILGRGNRIFPYTVIGEEPQDLTYRGSDTRVIIGDFNMIRESVTVNRGTEKEDGITSIGDRCYLMAGCHIAHDCKLGHRIIMANGTLLGGHVHIHDDATLSGSVAVHHFTTIGSYSFVGGLSRVLQDVPPYMIADGNPARVRGVNTVGLQRKGFTPDTIKLVKECYRVLYRKDLNVAQAVELLRESIPDTPEVEVFVSFVSATSRGIIK